MKFTPLQFNPGTPLKTYSGQPLFAYEHDGAILLARHRFHYNNITDICRTRRARRLLKRVHRDLEYDALHDTGFCEGLDMLVEFRPPDFVPEDYDILGIDDVDPNRRDADFHQDWFAMNVEEEEPGLIKDLSRD